MYVCFLLLGVLVLLQSIVAPVLSMLPTGCKEKQLQLFVPCYNFQSHDILSKEERQQVQFVTAATSNGT